MFRCCLLSGAVPTNAVERYPLCNHVPASTIAKRERVICVRVRVSVRASVCVRVYMLSA